MAVDILTLAMARKFTKDTANALGAVKGASCTIESIEDTGSANVVTFGWTDAQGGHHTSTMTVNHGAGVADMHIDDNGMLTCTLTDGTVIEVGKLPSIGGTGGGSCDPSECFADQVATDDDIDPLLSAIGLYDMTTAYLLNELNEMLTDESDSYLMS